jgi:hypothetical protein
MFFEEILISGELKKVVFDQGSQVKRVIRGTEVSDLRPFIICEFIPKNGAIVIRDGETFFVKEVQKSACGFVTAFLEKKHGNRSDYLN